MKNWLSAASAQTRNRLFWILVGTLFGYSTLLIFWNLGHVSFWDDEAHVAILAKNHAQYGAWTAWDGRNLFPDHNSQGLNHDLTYSMVQLDGIIVSKTFELLAPTFFSARLPFAIAGVLTLAFFFLYLNRVSSAGHSLTLFCFGCLALSTNFIFWVRTSRYYALAGLFALSVWCLYKLYLAHRKSIYLWMLSLCAILLFYSSALCGAAFLMAVAITHFVLYYRTFKKRDWIVFALPLALLLICAVLYVVRSNILAFDYTQVTGTVADPWYIKAPILTVRNLRDASTVGMLPWFILLCAVVLLLRQGLKQSYTGTLFLQLLAESTCLSLAYIGVLSVLSPQLTNITYFADIRYLTVLLPFFAVLAGCLLWSFYQWAPVIGVFLFLLVINTNVFTLRPKNLSIRLFLPGAIKEILMPYPTAYSEVTKFMGENAKPGETWYAEPPFMNKPLLFTLGREQQLCCVLDYKTPLPKEIVRKLEAPLFIEENFPDWYIAINMKDYRDQHLIRLGYFSRLHYENGRLVTYPYTLYRWLNVFWDQTQRPELFWHSYGPVKDFKPEEGVFIFKKGAPIYLQEGEQNLNQKKPQSRQEKP